MRKQDFGIDEAGRHDRRLTRVESRFLGVLWLDHAGEDHKIPADDLALAYARALGCDTSCPSDTLTEWKRDVRYLQNHLLTEHNIPVYSKAGKNGGYWLGESEVEGERFYNTFRKRGLTGLLKASRGKQAVMVEMVQQLSFAFDGLEDRTGTPLISTPGRSTPAEVVDAFIGKMMREPERFSQDLRRLGRKYGSVLLPKSKFREIEQTTRKLQSLVEGLTK